MKFKSTKHLFQFCIFLCLFSMPFHAQEGSSNRPKRTAQKIGDIILFALPAATVGASIAIGDEPGVWQFTKGLLFTAGITNGLKYTINKQRPDRSNNNSFPSSHTSTTFHCAGYIHRRYGFKYSIPAYALASFTAASRIDSKKHDFLDVFVGAAIGWGSNLLFTTEYQREHMELSFASDEHGHMLSFVYKF